MRKYKNIHIDMWNQKRFVPKKYHADAFFYPHGSFGFCYRGNIYDDSGKVIGDYSANDCTVIEENFIISWRK